MTYRIFPISECAVTIDFGNEISLELNKKVIELANVIETDNFIGFVETVPAYSSLTIFFDFTKVKQNYGQHSTAFLFVKSFIENSLPKLQKLQTRKSKTIEIPVSYDAEFAIDLEFVARNANLTKDEVIKIHTAKTYRVFMIGFLPAFAYLGELDERIATPRQSSPRTKIAKGSVGIAGKQTGIYPLESPGGWQIIGKTELEIFTPNNKTPSILQTGDFVKFYQI